jgi:hypothetical protein
VYVAKHFHLNFLEIILLYYPMLLIIAQNLHFIMVKVPMTRFLG